MRFLAETLPRPTYQPVQADSLVVVDDNANDVSTSKHGFVPKAPGDPTEFLAGDGMWRVPASTPAPPLGDPVEVVHGGTGQTTTSAGFNANIAAYVAWRACVGF